MFNVHFWSELKFLQAVTFFPFCFCKLMYSLETISEGVYLYAPVNSSITSLLSAETAFLKFILKAGDLNLQSIQLCVPPVQTPSSRSSRCYSQTIYCRLCSALYRWEPLCCLPQTCDSLAKAL